jgi:hypothetical protein
VIQQGSVFFVTKDGVFMTAKHVVDTWSADSHSVIALHFGMKAKKHCRVVELERHPDAPCCPRSAAGACWLTVAISLGAYAGQPTPLKDLRSSNVAARGRISSR